MTPEPVICQRCWALLHPDHTAEHETFCDKVAAVLPFEVCGEDPGFAGMSTCRGRKGHADPHIFYANGAYLIDPRR